ncbi:MAG: NADH-quinone oxidoreductase subunit C [Gorillibacterium sp.]|nr:NADH-quinone oxidoreductase subunit C [Gorillibacterium sp.]
MTEDKDNSLSDPATVQDNKIIEDSQADNKEETLLGGSEGQPAVAETQPVVTAATAPSDEEAKAARAARAAERAASAQPAAAQEPSPNQPRLDRMISIIREAAGEDAVSEAYINVIDGHRPYLVVPPVHWPVVAGLLRDHEELHLDYLRSVAGIDYEMHMEVGYYLISLDTKDEVCIKVKTNREQPSIPTISPIWPTANWNEREIYDLFGIDFPGHPDLRRILMPDDWIGHPMRKDYEPLDPEV